VKGVENSSESWPDNKKKNQMITDKTDRDDDIHSGIIKCGKVDVDYVRCNETGINIDAKIESEPKQSVAMGQ